MKSPQLGQLFAGSIVALLIVGAFFAGTQFAKGGGDTVLGLDSTQPQGVDFDPVWRAWNVLNTKYVPATSTDPVTDQDRVWGMIAGMTNALGDPYTVFFPPEDAELFESEISGNFEGVGMEIGMRDDVLTVVAPLKDTPAYKAGIESGDTIIQIDGESTQGITVDKAVKKIRGERGTSVEFTIIREGEDEPLTISVVRDVINIPTVSTDVSKGAGLREDGVYVIELYNFSATSQFLFREALRSFIESGSDKLILDLRGNPGGYLEAAVDMASWFLPTGKVVVSERGEEERIHRSRGYAVFNENLKMAILVNGGSASASEILAGALQEHGIATLVGEQTFGKGSVQELVDITPETSLKVTVARWFTPNGTSISERGLTPDIEVERTREDYENDRDPQKERAAEYLKSL